MSDQSEKLHDRRTEMNRTQSAVELITGDLLALRRRLHRVPEVGLHLPQTQQALLKELSDLPVEVHVGRELSSVIVVVHGRSAGPTVLVRSDMDALPVRERTELLFASTNGAMHACGHDLHMAALIGAVRILCERRDAFDGSVVAVFQPGEEGAGGAELMLKEGLLEVTGSLPVASYALHVFSYLERGQFASRSGVLMAGLLIMEIEVIGRGGHAARPFDALDPILVGAEIVQAIQLFVSRRINPADPAVVTVGAFNGGYAANIIPDTATLQVGIRTFSEDSEALLRDQLPVLASSIAHGHGLIAHSRIMGTMPRTVNDAQSADFVRQTVVDLFGENRYQEQAFPEMIAEDFSHILNATGGAMVLVGADENRDPLHRPPSNHSPLARFDDSVLFDAASLLAQLPINKLADPDSLLGHSVRR